MNKDRQEQDKQDRPAEPAVKQRRPEDEPPETALHPAPHIRHAREPSAENLMPAEDEPGTL